MNSALVSTDNIMDRTKNKADVSLFENESEAAWTEAEEKAVRRKLDLNLVPILTLMYLVCFVSLPVCLVD